jgi:divinyl chlorophyllide a 8-vinyl-reductase
MPFDPPNTKRVILLGASGTIGRAVHAELINRGFEVTFPARGQPWDAMAGHEVLISCMASRTGVPKDAWAVDHKASLDALCAAQTAGVKQIILLSAICVQKPLLAFQHAKLAFEAEVKSSGLTWTIVRPTAYFKSVSGQVKRVMAGKPYLLFGDGTLTSCLPISDRDLARFIVNAIDDAAMHNAVLPIGGPGPALTPRAMGEMIFELSGKTPRFRRVPVAMLDVIIAALSVFGTVLPKLKNKAELARIGRYYATESMLVWDASRGIYDADATPQFGEDTLREHYARMISGEVTTDLGEHAVF